MPPDFAKQTVDLVAKRAAYFCSNPDCNCHTVGANADPGKAIVIGEAAHIFGARAGSFRYRTDMSELERSTPTNAIWLCATCHSKIDKDEITYPADLLFMWKIRKENSTTQASGKAGDILRSEFIAEEIRAFSDLPIYARQLLVTKPEKWEYYLTAELMLHYLKPVMQKKFEIEAELYTLKNQHLPGIEFLSWIQLKFSEVVQSNASLTKVLAQFQTCWGPHGLPGDPHLIKRNCELFANCGRRLVELAEDVKFATYPEEFEDISNLFVQGVLYPLEAFQDLPQRFKALLDSVTQSGEYRLDLVIELPKNWEVEMGAAIMETKRKITTNDFWESAR